MEITMISNEAYAKIVNLLKTFYMQGFEDAANCPEPVDVSEDIEKQLNTVGIYSNDNPWIQYLQGFEDTENEPESDECSECDEYWDEYDECGEYNELNTDDCSEENSQELHNNCLAHMQITKLSNISYDYGFDI